MVVTIDGPAGAGKSTVARALARELGFAYLDTGALYRAVALAASWDGVDPDDEPVVEAWLTRVELEVLLEGGRFVVRLQGREVEPFIRNEEIGQLASRLSALAPVRDFLLELQRSAARQGDLVAEGRDMGTVVFPRAEAKFFLTADDRERARRRWLELKDERPELTLDEVLQEMRRRDERDASRKLSPLQPAPGAEVVDTTGLSPEEVVKLLAEKVRKITP